MREAVREQSDHVGDAPRSDLRLDFATGRSAYKLTAAPHLLLLNGRSMDAIHHGHTEKEWNVDRIHNDPPRRTIRSNSYPQGDFVHRFSTTSRRLARQKKTSMIYVSFHIFPVLLLDVINRASVAFDYIASEWFIFPFVKTIFFRRGKISVNIEVTLELS